MLTLQVHEKEIEITSFEEFVRGTVGKTCQINLDEFWADYSNTIVFKRCGSKPINILIDKLSNTLTIPFEVMAESGVFRIGVFGVAEDKVLPTLWSSEIKVRYGTDTFGTAPSEYTPDEIEQLKTTKQDKLTAGDNITIDGNNVISAIVPEITIDNELSTTSENAVQNKVVTKALSEKANSKDVENSLLEKQDYFADVIDGASDRELDLKDVNGNTVGKIIIQNDGIFITNIKNPTSSSQKDYAINQGFVENAIATQVSSVYKAKGSIPTIADLPTPSKETEGFVYNIESEFTTNSNFVEGVGKTYPAGTNVVIVNTTGTEYKYDVLAGMVDLSDYATKKYVDDTVGNITTTEAEEHAQIDSTEIITAQTGTWVTDGWTGNATTGFTHTSGNTSILKYPITGSDYTAEGTLYDITFNCSIAPTVDNIMVRIGNSDLFNLYGQEEPLNIGVKSKGSTDGTIYLEFIPSSTFTGTISNIKLHKITGAYVGKYKITDSNGSTSFEVRADTVNKSNAFIGVGSGSYNTTGNGNVGFGYNALASNTSGFWNTGIGFEALQFVNAGSRNIGIGALAGRHIETGQRNIAIGTHSLRENKTGNYNIAIGADSQINGKSGNSNISIGGSSLYHIDGGNENIAIGHNAIAGNNTENKGNYNIAIGFNSLTYGSNSLDNIAIGRNAGYRITGSNNVIIGTDSGRRGNSQVVMGANSGKNLQDDATKNTIIGYSTGNNLKANKNCILIGNGVDGEETGDYQLNIGNLIKGSMQSSNKYVNIDGSLSAKNMSVDNVGTNNTAVVNKKYVDDAIGNINSILATMFNDVSTQSDEEPTDEEVIA